jgi:hypothetical protein
VYGYEYLTSLNRRWTQAKRTQKTFMNKIHLFSINLANIFKETIHLEEQDQLPPNEELVYGSTSRVHKDIATSTDIIQTRKPFSDLGNKQRKRRSGGLSDYLEE